MFNKCLFPSKYPLCHASEKNKVLTVVGDLCGKLEEVSGQLAGMDAEDRGALPVPEDGGDPEMVGCPVVFVLNRPQNEPRKKLKQKRCMCQCKA